MINEESLCQVIEVVANGEGYLPDESDFAWKPGSEEQLKVEG
jgi:hypothetical protein